MPPILLTRPRAASEEAAQEIAARGIGPVVVAPLMAIEILPVSPPDGALILTSRNAVAAWAASGGAPRPAWVVGPRTAEAARAAGLRVLGAAPDAERLVGMVGKGPVVHLRGEHARGVAGRLRARGLEVAEVVAYRQPALALSAQGRATIRAGVTVAPAYSPRGARLLGNECPPGALGHLRVPAISAAAASALRPGIVHSVAASPDGAAMLDAIEAAWRTARG